MSIPKNLRTLKTNFEEADGLGISWLMRIWAKYPWNKFDEKAQCDSESLCKYDIFGCPDFLMVYKHCNAAKCIKITMPLQKLFHPTSLCLKNIPKTRQQSMYLMVIVSIIVQWSPQNFPVSSLFCAKEHLVMMISIIPPPPCVPRHTY